LEKILKMDCDEAISYVKDNVNDYDYLELSYNRVFTPGEVISVETDNLKGKDVCNVMIQVKGDTVRNTIMIDLEEVKDDLIEMRHVPKGEEEGILIEIERCEI
jgi:hypothetical protein